MWIELSHINCLFAIAWEENDQLGTEHVRRRHCIVAHWLFDTQSFCLFKEDWLLDVVLDFIVLVLFSLKANLRHVLCRFLPIGAERSFTSQNQAVNAIRYSLGDVCNFGSRWSQSSYHRVHDFSWKNTGFLNAIAPFDDVLLDKSDVFNLKLETQLASSNNDSIRLFEKLIEVSKSLSGLEFG